MADARYRHQQHSPRIGLELLLDLLGRRHDPTLDVIHQRQVIAELSLAYRSEFELAQESPAGRTEQVSE
jgi:hypothetical protein